MSFKKGEAPWEQEEAQGIQPASFKAGSAPWETPEAAVQEEPTFNQKLLNMLKPVGQALDWGGGIVRTGVGEAIGAATGNDVVKDGDWARAAKGQAPSSSELLDRAGLPQGGQLSDVIPGMYSDTGEGLALQKGGWADPTPRGAAGLAMDIGTDPLTYLTLGGSAVAKAGKVGAAAEKALKPASNLMERLGKDIYKSGLKRIDQEAVKYGKEPVSDLLMREGVTGSYGSINKQMEKMASDRAARAKGILAEADQAGAKVDMSAAMKDTDQMIAEMRASRDPKLQAAADDLEAEVTKYKALDSMPAGEFGPANPIGVQQANDFKTSIYNSLPKGAWAESVSGMNPKFIQGQKTQARGLKEGVEGAAASIGKGEELKSINDELGRLLTTQDRAQAEALKEANKNAFTSVDGIIAGTQNPWLLAAKKAADVAKMTGPRTSVGKVMYDQGRGQLSGPIWDIMLRQQLINRDSQE